MAAATWIHRRDQLHPRREGDMRIGAGDRHFAGFQRLAQRIEHGPLKFRQFVEEQHAQMRHADLARPRLQTAADQRCHRRAMMGVAERPRPADPPAI